MNNICYCMNFVQTYNTSVMIGKKVMYQISAIVLVALSGSISKIYGQSSPANGIALTVRSAVISCDSVLIRWAPNEKSVWKKGLTNGYKISRYVYSYGDSIPPNALSTLVVLDSLILPADTSVWSEMMDTLGDAHIELAGGAIFGDSLEITLGDTSELMQAHHMDSELETRYQMNMLASEFSFFAAHLSGLAFIDTTAVEGEKYVYMVELYGDSVDQIIAKGITRINCEDTSFMLPVPEIMLSLGKGGFVTLGWKGYVNTYIRYEVQRSENGENFNWVSEMPSLNSAISEKFEDRFMYLDTVGQIDHTYIYRVRGVDAFGRNSAWSDTVNVLNRPNPVGIIPSLDSLIIVDNESVDIFWSYPSAYNEEIEGFEVLRAIRDAGPYEVVSGEILLSPVMRTWEDTSPGRVNFYKIKVYDIYGYQTECWSHLAQLTDTIPPGKPSGTTGICDNLGIVTVSWLSNTEDDVAGYRVFFSNQDTLYYTQVTLTPVQDTFFQYELDLETLESETWVSVRAVDYNGNLSDFSDPALVNLPDLIGPSPAVITRSGTQEGINRIYWTPSESSDIDKYLIKRRKLGEPEWVTLAVVSHSPGNKNYIDTVSNGRQAYEYTVEALDMTGNGSLSNVAVLQGLSPQWPVVDSIDIAVVNGTGPWLNKKIGIAIGWDYGVIKELVGFKIYRSKDGEGYVQYVVYNLEEAQGEYDSVASSIPVDGEYWFVDHKVKHTHRYRYKVVALFEDGTTSPMSDPAMIIFNL